MEKNCVITMAPSEDKSFNYFPEIAKFVSKWSTSEKGLPVCFVVHAITMKVFCVQTGLLEGLSLRFCRGLSLQVWIAWFGQAMLPT